MKVLIATLIVIVSLAADEQPVMPEKWQNPTVWRNIKTGQTPVQVRQILGEPAATESTKAIEAWYYGDIPKTDENGKTVRPEHGCLMFRRTPTEHVLQKWVQPDWQTLPTWEQLQADYKQALADQRAAEIAESKRIADEAAAARAEQVEERRLILAEKTALQQQQQKARTVARQEQRQNTQRASIPAAKPDAHTIFTSRYFITIGGVFVLIAFVIACTQGFRMFNK